MSRKNRNLFSGFWPRKPATFSLFSVASSTSARRRSSRSLPVAGARRSGGAGRARVAAPPAALQRHAFHARLERVAAEGRHDGDHRGQDGDADQQRDQEDRIGERRDDLTCHDNAPQTSKFIILRITKMPIDIQAPAQPRMMCPVDVTNSGMMYSGLDR